MGQSLEYKKQYNKERREWLKSIGICVHCGKQKAEEGRVLCGDCAYKSAEHHSNRWYSLTPEQKKESYKKAEIYRKKQREERIKNGLCTKCGHKLPDTTYKTCWECRQKQKKTTKARNRRNGVVSREVRYSGLVCCQCCKPIRPNRSNLCPECYERCVGKAALMRQSPKWRENIDNGYFRQQNNLLFEKRDETIV